MQNRIILLSDYAINKIAAGEVLDRPVSALKELIENSIDAQADKIDIKFDRGGRNFISVTDNGRGIACEDIPLAFCRYTTSKVDENSLDNIQFMGFRGEALASISSVSETTIITKTKDDENAWQMSVDSSLPYENFKCGNYSKPTLSSHINGTTVIVRNLFSSTPNKLKFLKSEQSENAMCIDLLQRMAISNPHISFTLSINDKQKLLYMMYEKNTPKALHMRIKDVFGEEFYENSIPIKNENENISIFGRISIPTYCNASSQFGSKKKKQYCYVNKRIVKEDFLYNAIRIAYDGLVMHREYPIVVLLIDVIPKLVDVNVHPNKLQVRFWNEKQVRDMIVQCMRRAIENASTSTHITQEFIKDKFPHNLQHTNHYKRDLDHNRVNHSDMLKEREQEKLLWNMIENLADNRNQNNSNHNLLLQDDALILKVNKHSTIADSINGKDQEEELIEETISKENSIDTVQKQLSLCKEDKYLLDMGRAIAQIDNTYIISLVEDGFIIIDQHAAHERIILEQIKVAISDNKQMLIKKLLLPEILDFDAATVANLISIKEEMLKIGLLIDYLTPTKIVLSAVPQIGIDIDTKSLLKEIADDTEFYDAITHHNYNKIYSTIACHTSIRAGRTMSIDEMNALLRMMENTQFASQCNHGRPTYIKILHTDLKKIFRR